MTFRPVWTADRIDQMLALKAEGLSDYQVAARMGCSRTAVANKLSRMRHPQVRTRPATGWTEDRVALVKTLWIAGKSAQEVADALNRAAPREMRVTRNAVIGLVHRKGLSNNGRAPAARPARPVKQAAERLAATNRAKAAIVSRMNAEPAKPRPPKVEAVPLAAIESPNARPWMEREFGQCAWPLGEAGAIMSCCNPVSRGSWCEGHAAVGYLGLGRNEVVHQATWFTRNERNDLTKRAYGANRPASPWDDARAAA
jgi:GcrA cell cycle regulator